MSNEYKDWITGRLADAYDYIRDCDTILADIQTEIHNANKVNDEWELLTSTNYYQHFNKYMIDIVSSFDEDIINYNYSDNLARMTDKLCNYCYKELYIFFLTARESKVKEVCECAELGIRHFLTYFSPEEFEENG